jgi:uncharacterized protein (TIGR03790 family)
MSPLRLLQTLGVAVFKMTQTISKWTLWLLLMAMVLVIVRPGGVMGLEPAEVAIVANRQVPEGVVLARYYARKRGIPQTHLIVLDLTTAETCSRDEYERWIATPVRDYLAAVTPPTRIRCLVLFYGVPLKVSGDQVASVDSELTVVKAVAAPVGGWIENPFSALSR